MTDRTPSTDRLSRAKVQVLPAESGQELRPESGGYQRCEVDSELSDTRRNRAEDLLLELAGLAHDLRAPLAAIQQTITVMARGHYGGLTPTQHEALEAVLRRCTDLENLIGNVLDLARSEVGRLQPCFRPVRLEAAVARAVDQLALALKAAQITIRTENLEGTPLVFADPDMLERMLTNLLSNAIRVSPPGGTITIRTLTVSLAHVRLEIEDQGPGMSATAVRQLLRPFSRGTGTGKGYGLGLTIVRRLARTQHASINVRTAPGAGTTFAITFLKFDPRSLVRRFASHPGTDRVVGCLCRVHNSRLFDPMHRLLSEEMRDGVAIPLQEQNAVLLIGWGQTARKDLENAVRRMLGMLEQPIVVEWIDQQRLREWPQYRRGAGQQAEEAGVKRAG